MILQGVEEEHVGTDRRLISSPERQTVRLRGRLAVSTVPWPGTEDHAWVTYYLCTYKYGTSRRRKAGGYVGRQVDDRRTHLPCDLVTGFYMICMKCVTW